ncbi:MAG: peptide chain release factor 1 [Candidatus Sumerlaeia bacterium]
MEEYTKRLQSVARQKEEIEAQLADPQVVRDPKRYADLTRQHRDLNGIMAAQHECERLEAMLNQARDMQGDTDPELAEMAAAEAAETQAVLEKANRNLQLLLLPRDPNDSRNVIVEIRAGTGGEEAALFGGNLFRMYSRYAENRGWKIELLSQSESDLGGFKEIIFSINGEGAYSRLKYEGGIHRVQRVPVTETQGRIHTSAVTVAVMPEAEEVDVVIKPEDLRIDVFRSSGPGGQSVNTTDSAVRVTHLPTGLVVSCQDEKSQLKNKVKALKVLRARLLDHAQQEHAAEQSAQRKAQVGSGDRSGRIRTYNFPQNRLSDHRINLTIYNLDKVIDGDLDAVIDPLIDYYQAELLNSSI